MINVQHVYDFCNKMRSFYNAGFTQRPAHNGVTIIGEYFTRSGQLMTITLSVTKQKVEVKIYDATRRVVFNTSIKENINNNMRLNQFIHNSVTQ